MTQPTRISMESFWLLQRGMIMQNIQKNLCLPWNNTFYPDLYYDKNVPKSMTFLCCTSILWNWQMSWNAEYSFTGWISRLISALVLSLHFSITDWSTMCATVKLQLHASAKLKAIPWLICVTASGPWWNNRYKVTDRLWSNRCKKLLV